MQETDIRTEWNRLVHSVALSGQWLICHREPRCGQHLVAICMCHEHVEGSETERLLLRPHVCGIVYLLTSNSTGRRQHLSIAVLKLNICK